MLAHMEAVGRLSPRKLTDGLFLSPYLGPLNGWAQDP